MNTQNKRVLNITHLTFSTIIAVGFLIGILPTFYFYIFFIIIPLCIANLVFSILKNDDTITYSIVNVIMSVLAFIPLLGWIAEVIGITVSILSVQELAKILNPTKDVESSEAHTVNMDEVKSTKKEHLEPKAEKKSSHMEE